LYSSEPIVGFSREARIEAFVCAHFKMAPDWQKLEPRCLFRTGERTQRARNNNAHVSGQ
jgi:hypothetical protein